MLLYCGLLSPSFDRVGYEEYARVAGVMVSIVAFQAVDPGSIPGLRRQQYGVTPSCSFGCTGLVGENARGGLSLEGQAHICRCACLA
jgi:hypothetical protein